jgi:hypothetical protein
MRTGSIKNKLCFRGVKCSRCVGLTTLPPSISRLSRQCGILNISQSQRPPRPVTRMALLYFTLLYSEVIFSSCEQPYSRTLPAAIVRVHCSRPQWPWLAVNFASLSRCQPCSGAVITLPLAYERRRLSLPRSVTVNRIYFAYWHVYEWL